MQALAIRVLEVRPALFLRTVRPAAVAGIVAGASAIAIRVWLPGSDVVRLIVAAVAALSSGLVALHLADRTFVANAAALLRRRSVSSDSPVPDQIAEERATSSS